MALDLRTGPRQQAFTAIISIIKDDPLLNRIVTTWRLWDGSSLDPLPSVDQMPCVGLTFVGGEVERIAAITDAGFPQVDLRTKPRLIIETWTAGTDAGDSHDLFDAIDNVLFPADATSYATIHNTLGTVGVTDWQLSRCVLPQATTDYTSTSIHATGEYQFKLELTQ